MTELTFRSCVESQLLASFLADKCKIENDDESSLDYEHIYTYSELSMVSGCNVIMKRHVIDTARRIVQRDCGRVFGTVRGLGIKLLEHGEIVEVGTHETRLIRKKTQRALKKLSHTDTRKLTASERLQFYVTGSYLGAIELMSRNQAQKKLEVACTMADKTIDMPSIAALFLDRKG